MIEAFLVKLPPNMNATGLDWWSVNIGSGNGSVPSGNIDPDLCRHMVSLGHNELTTPRTTGV